jgi:hypothetical protein
MLIQRKLMKRIFKFCFDDEKEINKENINLF